MANRPTNRGRKAPVRRKKKASIIDRILARIPLSHAALRRIATWTIVVGVLGVGYAAASWAGITDKVGFAIAEKMGDAGLRVDQIETRGSPHMDVMTVNAIALQDQSRSMLLYDVDATRTHLMEYGWVKDAQVSKRLPNTILIRITERVPAAIWQNQGALNLIDRDGEFIDKVSRDAMPDLPLIIGPGANQQEPAYQTLMVAAPALKPKVQAATWVGNRRWDLMFDTGETLSLPEGVDDAAQMLRKFAEMEATQHLLGGRFIKFDMRDTSRFVARKRDGSLDQPVGNDSTGTATTPNSKRSDGVDARSKV